MPAKVAEIENEGFIENECSDLEGQGIEKFIIPSNINDFYTRLQVLLGLRLFGHANTLTEASYLFDEIYKKGEKENENQNRNALDKFHTI